MKISYFSGAEVPSPGANSMHVMRMCQAIGKQGHEVTLYVRPGTVPSADDFAFYAVEPTFEIVKHWRPKVRVYGALEHAFRVRRTFRRRSLPDLIYAREYYCLAATANTGVPFIFESHWRPRHAAQRGLERWLLRHAGFRRLVVISEALRQEYLRMFSFLEPRRVLVAHDAADPVPAANATDPAGGRGPLRVGYVGSFFRGYGVQLLPRLAAELPEMEFHVVGGSAADIAGLEREIPTGSNLTYHGFVPPRELPKIYAQLDVVLAPYQPDTPHIGWISPMKLFEYMAHGKAIVCSDFPVMREILTEERDGLLVSATDVGAWRAALERLQDFALRERLARTARQKLLENHTWDQRAAAVLAGISGPTSAD